MIKINLLSPAQQAVAKAAMDFEEAFYNRSFSGRNPELGKMIKCTECGRRHRDNIRHDPIKYADKPGTAEGQSNPMIAESKSFRGKANPFWRAKPGVFQYIPELKKFLRITR
jgi:hypothetical protein